MRIECPRPASLGSLPALRRERAAVVRPGTRRGVRVGKLARTREILHLRPGFGSAHVSRRALSDPGSRGTRSSVTSSRPSPRDWRSKLLVSHETVVDLITATTTGLKTATRLKVRSGLDTGDYPKGVTVSDAQMETLHLLSDAFHGE
ncbi:MAG: hypothetical protein ACC726_09085 [Chloroflexota bacterium]